MNFGQTVHQIFLQLLHVLPHKTCQTLKMFHGIRQTVRLGVINHLQSVLNLAVRAIMIAQLLRCILSNPAFICQSRQCGHCTTRAQSCIPTTRNQLSGLGEKLDFTDSPAPQLYMVSRQSDWPVQPFVAADAQPHVMRILNCGKIQMASPHKRSQTLQKLPTCGQITCRRARFDISGPFPSSALAFVIALGTRHRHAHRCHAWVRAQSEIGPKHITFTRQVAQHRNHPFGRPHKSRPHFGVITTFKTGLIKQTDQINV